MILLLLKMVFSEIRWKWTVGIAETIFLSGKSLFHRLFFFFIGFTFFLPLFLKLRVG